jgi:oligopeptidase A
MATSRPVEQKLDSPPGSRPPPNPLLERADPLPFDRIRPEHVEPAADELLVRARAAVDAIANDAGPRTYASTLGALEEATEELERLGVVCEHLESAATSPELRDAWNRTQPKLSVFWSELALHAGLYAALRAYAETEEAGSLDPIRRRALDKTLDEFRRHGAELPPEGKKELTEIDVALTKATTKFQQNVLDSTNAYELVVDDEARLAGLPDLAKRAARAAAAQKGLPEGRYRFTLHAPSFTPALTHLDDVKLREELYRAHTSRAASGELDNAPLIREILELRCRKAKLLGFSDFSDFTTADRMAKSGGRAHAFIDDLRARTEAFFQKEREALRSFAGRELSAWDVAYYSEKQRKAQFDFDEELLRPYLPLETVLAGLFEILKRLYGVTFTPTEIPVWDPSVRPFRMVDDTGALLATVYVDLFPRENKVQGAWMAPLRTATPPGAHAAVVAANFTPPVGEMPALLSHREVETLFHELGHLMHLCLSRVPVRRLAGTSVAWDFVELPSQIMENWTWEREAVDLIARHYETGAPIPDDLFDKLRRSRTFRAASAQMQQLGYAEVDLDLHRRFDPKGGVDPVRRAREVLQRHVTASLPEQFSMVTSFGHLFASPVGYAAGYYSYKWAEVLEADAFSRFLEEGIFNRAVGDAFRSAILAKGDSEDPEVLYRRFRGREPTVDALMERQGLVPTGAST